MTRGDSRRAFAQLFAALRGLLSVRWIRWVAVLLLLGLGMRLALTQLLAKTINVIAAERGLVCDWDNLSLSILSGRGEVHMLELRAEAAEGTPPAPELFDMEFAVFDLDVMALLSGELRISRAEVDGLDSWWIREANGEWNVSHHVGVAELLAMLESTEEPDPEPTEPEPLQLDVPLSIESLRFQHAVCHVIDRSVTPAVELKFEMSARLSNLNDPERPLRFSATVLAGDLLDAARVEGTATMSNDEITLELRAQAGSLRPQELAHYLEPLDIHPVAESLEARLLAEIHVAVVGEARDALSARLELSEIHLMEDGVESLALDRLLFAIDSISAQSTSMPGIEIEGVRGRAALQADRSLHLAGFDIRGMAWLDALNSLSPAAAEGAPPSPPAEMPAALALLFEEDAEAYSWSLASLEVRNGLVDFTDRSVDPPAQFPLHIDSVLIGEVEHVPGQVTRTIPVQAVLRAPGMAETITLQGSFGPFAPQRSVDLELQVDGLVLDSLEHRMQRLGIARSMQAGSFHGHLRGEAQTDDQGRTTGRLSLERISLKDTTELFGVESVRVEDILIDPAANLLRLGDVEVSGTHMTAGRSATRTFFGLGLQFLGTGDPSENTSPDAQQQSTQQQGTPATAATGPSAPLVLPRIELGRFAWIDTRMEFVDALSDPPQHFSVDELSVELTNLSLGGAPDGPEREPATFVAHIRAPGMIDDLQVDGRIHSRPGPIDLGLELALRGSLGSGESVKPYLVAFGVEPTFEDAQVALDLRASVKQKADGWLLALGLENASLSDGELALLSCEALRVKGLRLGAGIEVEALEVHAPRAHARLDADGVLVVAGVRLVNAPGAAAPAAASDKPRTVQLELPPLPDVHVQHAQLTDARLTWIDATFEPSLGAELVVAATLDNLRTDGTPASYTAHVEVPEVLESLAASGELTIGPDVLGISAEILGKGLRAGPLTRLLPPGLQLESADGHLQAKLAASVTRVEQGGLALELSARDCSWGEPGAEPWLAARDLQLRAPRIDLGAGQVQVGPVIAEGLRVEGTRDADGTLHLLGLAIQSPPASEPQTPAKAGEEEEGAGAQQPSAGSAEFVLPRIELVDEVAFQLEHLRLRDASLGANARPIIAGASFRLQTPLVVLSDKPQELEPLVWRAEGTLDGMVELWSVDGKLAPFASEPSFDLHFQASGVRTAGVVESVPQLARLVEGEVYAGTLNAVATGTFSVRRARPLELGFARPFGADIVIENVEYRDTPAGTILAGVERISVEVKRVDSTKQLVHIDTIEILEPRGFVERKDLVVHALGFAVNLDAPSPAPASEQTSTTELVGPVPEHLVVEAAAKEASPAEQQPELRIDQLIVSGIDFEIRDSSVEPALRIPFSALDMELKRFTTRALREPLPIHFSSYLESGMQGDSQLFEEVAVAGRVMLYPAPKGWVQCSMTALELPYLAPLAAQQGLDIKDGAMDASARLRLNGEAGANVDTSVVFTDLSLEEPEGGWIERVLSLPMALDSALFILKDASGEHRFSAGFSVDESGVSTAQLIGAASGAFAEVLGRALAAAPLRLLGSIIPGGDETQEAAREAWALSFATGTIEPGADLAADIDAALSELRDDSDLVLVLRHELSPADVAHAERLANPPANLCLERIAGLRQYKARLLRARTQVATEASALYAIGAPDASTATVQLREHERQLATLEDTLDGLFEILRSDSPRQRLKRTRNTAREIAETRLAAIQGALQRQLPADQAERIQVRSPRFEVSESGTQVSLELRQR